MLLIFGTYHVIILCRILALFLVFPSLYTLLQLSCLRLVQRQWMFCRLLLTNVLLFLKYEEKDCTLYLVYVCYEESTFLYIIFFELILPSWCCVLWLKDPTWKWIEVVGKVLLRIGDEACTKLNILVC